MSGLVHSVTKVFHAVGHAVEGAVKWVGRNWEYVALAALAVYTGGLAMGWWGAGAAGAGGAGGAIGAGVAGGAEAGGAGGLGASAGAAGAAELGGAGSAYTAAGLSAGSGMTAGQMAVALGGSSTGSLATAAPFVSGSAAAAASSPFTSLAVGSAVNGGTATMSSAPYTWWDSSKGFMANIGKDAAHIGGSVANWFTSGSPAAQYGKMQLLSTGLKMAGAYFASKPQHPMNFSGRDAAGHGPGTAVHTTPGGFGFEPGGGQPAPTGVPSNMRGPGNTASLIPPSGANNPLSSPASQPARVGNLGQVAANAAGVGTLVPQGAVDFMKA